MIDLVDEWLASDRNEDEEVFLAAEALVDGGIVAKKKIGHMAQFAAEFDGRRMDSDVG
jgi:hypothetical protein